MNHGLDHPAATAARVILMIVLTMVTIGGLSATAAYAWHVLRLVMLNG